MGDGGTEKPILISIEEIMSLWTDGARGEYEAMMASLRGAKAEARRDDKEQTLLSLKEASRHFKNAHKQHGEIGKKIQELLTNLK